MEERDLFDELAQVKTHTLTCPHCDQAAEYQVHWLFRRKKKALPGNANDQDRALFRKARSYMLRRDDVLGCKNERCRKRFEIDGLQSIAFVQEIPNAPLSDREARIRATFGRRS